MDVHSVQYPDLPSDDTALLFIETCQLAIINLASIVTIP